MSDNFQVLVDSDAFVGRFFPDDHEKARELFSTLEHERRRLVTTSWVIAETATVLSHRQGQSLARLFLDSIEEGGLPVIHMSEALQHEAIQLFKQQEKRGTSMTDCGNAVVMRRFEIPTIFSFDEFYAKRLKLETLSHDR